MKIYDAFPTKAMAQSAARDMKKLGVQFAQVREKKNGGRLKYEVYLGGRNSGQYV